MRFAWLYVLLLIAGCAELPEERMSEPMPIPGRASLLSMNPVALEEQPKQVLPDSGTLAELLLLVDSSPALEAARQNVVRESGAAVQGSLAPNPVLRLESERIPFDEPGFGNARNKIGISQRFETAGKASSRVGVALANKDEAEAQYFKVRAELITEIAKEFQSVLYDGFREDAAKRLLALKKEQLHKARELQIQGRLSEMDLIGYEVEAQNAAVKLSAIQAEKRKTLRHMKSHLALEPGNLPRCVGQRDVWAADISNTEAEAEILSRNPSLIVMDRKVGIAHALREAADGKAYPDLNVGLMYSRAFDSKMDRDDFFGAFVEIPFPLVDRNQGGIQGAEAGILKAESDLVAEAYRLIEEWYSLIEVRRLMIDQHKVLSAQTELIRSEMKLMEQKVEAGRQSALAGIKVHTRFYEAELNELALEKDLTLNHLDLLHLIGREPTSNDLADEAIQ